MKIPKTGVTRGNEQHSPMWGERNSIWTLDASFDLQHSGLLVHMTVCKSVIEQSIACLKDQFAQIARTFYLPLYCKWLVMKVVLVSCADVLRSTKTNNTMSFVIHRVLYTESFALILDHLQSVFIGTISSGESGACGLSCAPLSTYFWSVLSNAPMLQLKE